MDDPYVAIRTSRDRFVSQYPHAVAEPVGELGFATFGSAPIDLSENLRRPDFDEVQLLLVLVRDEDLYLALAPPGEAVGYPPDYIKVRVTDWGPNVDPDVVRQEVRTEGDADAWSGRSDVEN